MSGDWSSDVCSSDLVSETVDFVQLIGAGIKDLGGSDDLEVELFFFFPSFDLVLFGTRCASFLPMAQLEELQQETNLDSISRSC